jgi:hypothetical protein
MNKVIVAILVLVLTGCSDRTNDGRALQSFQKLEFVNVPGLTFQQAGSSSGGTGAGFIFVDVFGELVSTNGASLPPNLAREIAAKIRTEFTKEGCQISENGNGPSGGVFYTAASGLKNVNFNRASVYYSLNGAKGIAEVLVIERNYTPEHGTKVVGQLVVTLNQSR